MRYAQTKALIASLLLDEKFNALSAVERKHVLERVMGAIKGRMMGVETKLAKPHIQVFQLQFAVGEFDMVVHDPEALTCEIYEVKYSKEAVSQQYQHLIAERKCADTEHRFGRITGRYVIYRGEPTESKGVQYLNFVMEIQRYRLFVRISGIFLWMDTSFLEKSCFAEKWVAR